MRILSWMLGILAVSLTAQAGAGPEMKQGTTVATPPAVLSEATPTVRDQRKLPGQTLRCWQHGRLVYEAGGFRGKADRNGAGIPIPRAVEGEPVTVFDMKDGMCILSSH